jgi:hypothetical protein
MKIEKKIKMILLKKILTLLLYVCVARTTEGNVLNFVNQRGIGQTNSFIIRLITKGACVAALFPFA